LKCDLHFWCCFAFDCDWCWQNSQGGRLYYANLASRGCLERDEYKRMQYVCGELCVWEKMDVDELCLWDIEKMVKACRCYFKVSKLWYWKPYEGAENDLNICLNPLRTSRTPTLKLSHIIIVHRAWRWKPIVVAVFAHTPTTHHFWTPNLQQWPLIFKFRIESKNLGFYVFWIGEELWHQFMEEILGILKSRWQTITLGFQIYIFGEEKAVNEKEEKK